MRTNLINTDVVLDPTSLHFDVIASFAITSNVIPSYVSLSPSLLNISLKATAINTILNTSLNTTFITSLDACKVTTLGFLVNREGTN